MTCDRPELTKRVLDSMVEPGELHIGHATLLHGDDASSGSLNHEYARTAGFETVIQTGARVGAFGLRKRLIEAAVLLCNPTHILVWENDWECVRPIPWRCMQKTLDEDTWQFRLFGTHKQRDKTRPAGAMHAGKNGRDPDWKPDVVNGVKIERGDIHWSTPPTLCRTEELMYLLNGATCDKDMWLKSGQLSTLTARVVQNVVWHVGFDQTPGFIK
jgi:hypothetical protein